MKSIMQSDNDQSCYLCGATQGLEIHHTWHGTANRKLADRDGLMVRLCCYCHRALHDKGRNDRELMMAGERAWLTNTGKTIDDFRARYGMNVL